MSREEQRQKYEQKGVAMTCRSYQEYMDMFMLQEDYLREDTLDVSAGASSFTRELNDQGYRCVAVDPLYAESPSVLYHRGIQEMAEAARKLDATVGLIDWNYYGSLENHYNNRERSLRLFIDDFSRHHGRPRYTVASLPRLPFEDETFSLILCSHFLFLYGEQFDVDFHYKSLQELHRLCRPGGEVRVYPMVGFDGNRYGELETLQRKLEQDGVLVDCLDTSFRFLKGATQILRLRKKVGG